jgi:hypothetical protein
MIRLTVRGEPSLMPTTRPRWSMQALLSIPQFKALFPDIEPKIAVTNY